MKNPEHFCPACARPFKTIQDYPRILVTGVEVYDPPLGLRDESEGHPLFDTISQKELEEIWKVLEELPPIERYMGFLTGLGELSNIEIDTKDLNPSKLKRDNCFQWAFKLPDVELSLKDKMLNSLADLASYMKQEFKTTIQKAKVLAEEFNISLKEAHSFVKDNPNPERVYPADYYISLRDEEPPAKDKGICKVQLHTDGPNMGSAGGPTLLIIGILAEISYIGQTLK